MKTLRGVVVCISLSLLGCGEPERVDEAATSTGGGVSDAGAQPVAPADGGGQPGDAMTSNTLAGDGSAAAADVAVAGGETCAAHSDCARGEICGDQQLCVAGCLPENEPCDPSNVLDERCCEHFHCCPVFKVCVPNWWE